MLIRAGPLVMIVVHPADTEQVYGVRLRMVVTSRDAFLKAYDQAAWIGTFGDLESLDEGLARW